MKTLSGLWRRNPFDLFKQVAIFSAVGAAFAQIARFLLIAFARIDFPFTLEWMEGGSFIQVSRIMSGQLLYVRPSFDFIPQIYPPVYYYLSAFASMLLGSGFTSLRLVSIASTIGILLLVFVLVRRQSGSNLGGILASGLFCSTYQLSGYWFDLARVDSLALALLLLSAYLLLENNPISSIFGGIVLALSCFTKQTILIIAVVFAIYCVLPPRRNTLLFVGTALLGLIGGTFMLNWVHDGWFTYYIFHLPGRHRVIPNIVPLLTSTKDILFDELVKPIFFAVMMGLVYLYFFPEKMSFSDRMQIGNKETISGIWPKRAVWLLVVITELTAIGSLWFLLSLPSDAGRGLVGSYTPARLILMTGPAFMGIIALVFTIKMVKDSSRIDHVASIIYGKVQRVPRLILSYIVAGCLLILILVHYRPGILDSLSNAHLQRLAPYLFGPMVLVLILGISWRLLWPATHMDVWFFWILGVGLVATSWFGRLNPGGYYNVFMPGYAGISILFGLGIDKMLEKSKDFASTSQSVISIITLVLSGIQLITLLTSPFSQIPTPADMKAGLDLVNQTKACPGNVYFPFHTYLATLAGKDSYAGVVEMGELRGTFGGKADPLWNEVLNQIQFTLRANTFSAIVQDNQVFRDALSTQYKDVGRVFHDDLMFWPVTGRKIRPETVYAPINSEGCHLEVK